MPEYSSGGLCGFWWLFRAGGDPHSTKRPVIGREWTAGDFPHKEGEIARSLPVQMPTLGRKEWAAAYSCPLEIARGHF